MAQFLATPGALTFVLPAQDPDHPVFAIPEVVDAHESVPELEALSRWAMVLHDQYPWDRSRAELRPAAEIGDDDFVVALHPRNRDVLAFIERVRQGRPSRRASAGGASRPAADALPPVRPYPPVRVREAFAVQPRLESLAVVRGEHICDNADVVRNSSFSWSPMSAAEISTRTGIDQRRYTSLDIGQLALEAARAALAHARRGADEIGAVLVATCTSDRLIPSLATWLSGELGILQTHCSADIVAACAGLPYGLAEADHGPTRVFAPGFGAGAVGGYAVLTVDPAIVAPEVWLDHDEEPAAPGSAARVVATTADDVGVAFGAH